jgi:hypothetical protein
MYKTYYAYYMCFIYIYIITTGIYKFYSVLGRVGTQFSGFVQAQKTLVTALDTLSFVSLLATHLKLTRQIACSACDPSIPFLRTI